MKIGIIGGKGIMGSIFSDLFKAQGVNCLISDVGTDLSNEELIEKSEVVIFSLPISITESVIEGLVPRVREDQMLVDLTSIKSSPLNAMLKSKAEVLGLHPMFGPGLESLKGQVVVYCPVRKRYLTEPFLSKLKQPGLLLKEITPQKHDELMAVVQGLNHISALIAAKTMGETGLSFNDSIEFATPVFKIRTALIARLMSEAPSLYADISLLNPNVKKITDLLRKNTEEICKAVEAGDKDSFVRFFSDAAEYFSDFSEAGVEQSNKLIQFAGKL